MARIWNTHALDGIGVEHAYETFLLADGSGIEGFRLELGLSIWRFNINHKRLMGQEE